MNRQLTSEEQLKVDRYLAENNYKNKLTKKERNIFLFLLIIIIIGMILLLSPNLHIYIRIIGGIIIVLSIGMLLYFIFKEVNLSRT